MIYLVLFTAAIAFIIAFCADRDNSALRSRIAVLESILNDTAARANAADAKRYQNHLRMNRLARKCKQRGKTIETLERRIGIMNAQMLVTDGVNRRLAPQVDALKTEKGKLTIENGRLKQHIEELESQIAELKRHDNCPFRRTAKNRISYCTKEEK